MRLLWGTANLFTHPRSPAGAATNPDPEVFAYAAGPGQAHPRGHQAPRRRRLRAVGRSRGLRYAAQHRSRARGARSWLASSTFVAEHKAKIGSTGQLLLEPKPMEPTKHQYDYDVATVHGSWSATGWVLPSTRSTLLLMPLRRRSGSELAEPYSVIVRALLVTTHPTGMNFPWKQWEDEKWLHVLGYQSGHGDDGKTIAWIHSGPPAEYGRTSENHATRHQPRTALRRSQRLSVEESHTPAENVRRAVYMSLLATPVAGVTYGGHGVWSWHERPGRNANRSSQHGRRESLEGSDRIARVQLQMGYVRKFFESLPWTKLRPAQDAVKQSTGRSLKVRRGAAQVRASDGSCYVFYFPSRAVAEITVDTGKSG